MSANCSVTQYGLPVLYELDNLQDFFHSCCHTFMTHIVDGHGLCREFKTSPHASDLASPVSMYKRDAAPHLIDSDAHVVLFVDSSNRECTVSQLVSQLLPGTRLTVFSCQGSCEQVLEGTTQQQSHDLLLSASVLDALGLTSTFMCTPHCSSKTGLPLFRCLVQTGCLSVKKKPLPATSFDSFVQLSTSQTVNVLGYGHSASPVSKQTGRKFVPLQLPSLTTVCSLDTFNCMDKTGILMCPVSFQTSCSTMR